MTHAQWVMEGRALAKDREDRAHLISEVITTAGKIFRDVLMYTLGTHIGQPLDENGEYQPLPLVYWIARPEFLNEQIKNHVDRPVVGADGTTNRTKTEEDKRLDELNDFFNTLEWSELEPTLLIKNRKADELDQEQMLRSMGIQVGRFELNNE